MKRLSLLIFLSFVLRAQNTPFYPSRALTINDVGVQTNGATTTLTAGIGSSDATIPVASTSKFTAPALIFIDTEEVRCLTLDLTHFFSCTRGIDNTTAASHSILAPVGNFVSAFMVNQVNAELIALENDILAGLPSTRGGTGFITPSNHALLLGTGSTWLQSLLVDCTDASGKHLNYATATHTFTCGTTSSTVGTVTNVSGFDAHISITNGTSTPVVQFVPQNNDYSFSQISGSLGAGQLPSSAVIWSSGAGAPSANCVAEKERYLDTTNQDNWFCSVTNTWKKILSTSNSGAIAITGANGSDPCGTVAASTDCLSFNASDHITLKKNGGTVQTILDSGTSAGGDLTGTYPNPTVAANAVTSAKMAVVNTRRTVCIPAGANNGAALVDADLGPQSRQYFVNAPWTLVEIEVAADAGTPNIIMGRSRAGSIVNLTSAALATASAGGVACSNTGGTTGIDGTTTCSSTLQNTSFNAGDWITLVSGTAGGTAKEMTACATFTVN